MRSGRTVRARRLRARMRVDVAGDEEEDERTEELPVSSLKHQTTGD